MVNGKFEYFFNQTDYQGNIRAATDAKGAAIEHNDYYPYGMLFGTSVGKDSKQPFKFGGKEYITAKGFNTYDFGARGMDSSNPRWTSVDQMAEKYPHISPYAYCANNPTKYIDPDGRDWYMSNDSSSYKWKDGSAEMDGYTNIGETFNMKINSTTTHTFTQNELTSITYTGISASNWVSQIAEEINCFQASSKMLANEGVTSAGRGSEILVVNSGENGRAGSGNSNLKKGVSVINTALENGNPIMVGVDYKSKSPNADGMTDHFIVISSMTEKIMNGATVNTTYNFFDPRTEYSNNGTHSNNTMSKKNNQISGTYNHGKKQFDYTVVTVRRNK